MGNDDVLSRGRLAGRVAIITGASTGCGPVMARTFAAEGARVVLAARRENLVAEVAESIGDAAIAVRADVTEEADVARMVDRTLETFGQVDILLNNAAVPGVDKFIWEQELDNWNETIAVDLTAAMLCTREVLKRSMLERGSGSIVNFSSIAGWTAAPRKSHYVAAKAALRALTKSTANEVGPSGIRCNCIVPGAIDTELWRNWIARMAAERGEEYDAVQTEMVQGYPLRTISKPEDIANLALFLSSDESRTITGQSINCDAGAYMAG
ncbi:SDR family NAD(P)-dependent oxidoreductase [Microbacterium sp. NPDC055357]